MINAISPGDHERAPTTLLGIARALVATILYVVAFVLIRGTTKVEA